MACLLHQQTDCTRFAIQLFQIICIQPFKRSLHFFSFLNYTSGYLKFWKFVCIFEMAWSRSFKNVYTIICWTFFCKHFYFKTGFKKELIFADLLFFQISRVEHKSFPMMYHLSYLDIKHGRGGGQFPGFQVPKQG